MSNKSAITLAGIREQLRIKLNEDNFFSNLIVKIEAKTKINREYIAFGAIGFIALYLIVGWGNDFLCNLIGFLYPAYASVKAIESNVTDDDTKWLMYWCVYAFFGILEFFGDQLLFWIPLYTLSKCLFLLWLMVPGPSGGSQIIYYKLIRPFVLKHQTRIDSATEDLKKKAKDLLSEKQQ